MTQDEIIEMGKKANLCDEEGRDDNSIIITSHLEAFAKLVAEKTRFEAADDAWIELVKHGIGWELRKAVTDAIHARDEA